MGLEPATCRLQIGCSTLLSYASVRVSAEESSTVRPGTVKWKRWHGFAHLGNGANRGLYQLHPIASSHFHAGVRTV